jgi:aspartate aminotransferase/aminotransferase
VGDPKPPAGQAGRRANEARLADRVRGIEPSGIRRIFELMASMQDPINLSIGQPHYDPPPELVEAACNAIREGKNRYTVTQGLPELNARILDNVAKRYGQRPETCLLTAGVSGGLVLSFQCLLHPGDEILLPDPGFVMYRHLATLCGASVKYYDLYPKAPGERFSVDLAALEAMCSERTKIVFVNSPGNPTGGVLTRAEIAAAPTSSATRSTTSSASPTTTHRRSPTPTAASSSVATARPTVCRAGAWATRPGR